MSNPVLYENGTPREMTDAETAAWAAEGAANASATAIIAYRSNIQKELDFSDNVAIRCAKAGIAYPPEWYQRDITLRALLTAGAGTVPPRPAFPNN